MTSRYPGIAVLLLALSTGPTLARADMMLTFGAPYFRPGAYTDAYFDCAIPGSMPELFVSIRTMVDIPGFPGVDFLIDDYSNSTYGYPPPPGGAAAADPARTVLAVRGHGLQHGRTLIRYQTAVRRDRVPFRVAGHSW